MGVEQENPSAAGQSSSPFQGRSPDFSPPSYPDYDSSLFVIDTVSFSPEDQEILSRLDLVAQERVKLKTTDSGVSGNPSTADSAIAIPLEAPRRNRAVIISAAALKQEAEEKARVQAQESARKRAERQDKLSVWKQYHDIVSLATFRSCFRTGLWRKIPAWNRAGVADLEGYANIKLSQQLKV